MLAQLQFQLEAASILAVLLSAALHKQNQQDIKFPTSVLIFHSKHLCDSSFQNDFVGPLTSSLNMN